MLLLEWVFFKRRVISKTGTAFGVLVGCLAVYCDGLHVDDLQQEIPVPHIHPSIIPTFLHLPTGFPLGDLWILSSVSIRR